MNERRNALYLRGALPEPDGVPYHAYRAGLLGLGGPPPTIQMQEWIRENPEAAAQY
ncbi:unnamed protein product [Amoebophrya sp. A25]|nr:unnamed protein product [Amoebophrya sp. A25]|eukprot:GSA25T00018305001.1